MNRILIIDDEPAIGWSLREVLRDEGHSVELAASVEAGMEVCRRFEPDVMLLDVRLPGRDGISALPEFRAIVPKAPLIVMTAFGDLATAVRAVNAGAFEYLVKPFDLDRVSQVVSRALAARQSAAAAPTSQPAGAADAELVGRSPPMQTVFRQIALVAPTDLPVLITGETGTGKELAARAIHSHGPRNARPLVVTSLVSLAPSVVESELFGHVRGAFTGAIADRKGLFELADGGTIFLDEMGDVPAEVQAKLLRVLEQGEIVPVGSAEVRKVDVRVIAATNRDLGAAIAGGGFRADLFHRLRVFPIQMPSLADRLDDVPLLVEAFLRRGKAGAAGPSPEFLAAVSRRRWPGNVRELEHAIEYARVVACDGPLRPEHLPPEARPGVSGSDSVAGAAGDPVGEAVRGWVREAFGADEIEGAGLHARLLELVEATLADEALSRTGGNLTAAAKILGVDRATLRARLKR